MRLRLSIHRHELPAVKILWNVPSDSTTVSKLLEQVSEVIPLESDGWGVEDYVVHVNGYECLHYLDVHGILTEDDELTIRALQTSDIRARTISGRHQISTSGAHLIDGIAFGRTYLRRPDRPQIYIPPRKRRRISHDYDDEYGMEITEPGTVTQLRITSTFDDADEAEDELDGFQPEVESENPSSFASEELPETGRLRSGKRRKSVSFDESSSSAVPTFDIFEDGDDEDEEDEEDFEPEESEESEGSEDDELEDTEGLAEVASKSTKSKKSTAKAVTNLVKKRPRSASDSSSDSSTKSTSTSSSSDASSSVVSSEADSSDSDISSSDTSSSSSSDDEEEESATLSYQSPEKTLEKAPGPPSAPPPAPAQSSTAPSARSQIHKQGVPGQGKISTKTRNQRRKESRKLKYLTKAGLLDPTATVPKSQPENTCADNQDVLGETAFEQKRRELLDAIAAGGVDIDHERLRAKPSKRAEIANGSPDVFMTNSNPPKHKKRARGISKALSLAEEHPNGEGTTVETEGPKELGTDPALMAVSAIAGEEVEAKKRRTKLDLASSRRLLFGSLGVRNPKNKADEEKLRAKLSSKPERNRKDPSKATTPTSIAPVEAGAHDIDAWKGNIRLTAVECSEEGITLSTPPFPFVQRWDPQQQNYYKRSSRTKKRKRGSQYFEDQDQSQANEGWLDYDEPPEELPIGHLNDEVEASSQLQQDIIKSSQDVEDDLPLLPSNIESLPSLKTADMQINAVIAFKQLECSQDTDWQPTISAYRTAVIDNIDEPESQNGELHLTLAKRDCKAQEFRYDDDGNRILGKFEMAEDSADEEDEEEVDPSKISLLPSDMLEPKLVRAAPASAFNSTESKSGASLLLDSQILLVQDSMDPNGDEGPEEAVDLAQDSMFTNENPSHEDADAGSSVDEEPASLKHSQHSNAEFVDVRAVALTQSDALADGLVLVV